MISENTRETLDHQSMRNAIEFYQEELLKIEDGEKATEHFNERQRKSLVKQGILERKYGHGGCKLRLTSETKRILKRLGYN
jgi:hypothetical protein